MTPRNNKTKSNEMKRIYTAYGNRDDNISPPEITALQIEERLVRDDITDELYMPL